MKQNDGSGKPRSGKFSQERTSISLAAFAGARKQKYNKLKKLEQQRNLNAKKVNQYKKIKNRLMSDSSYAARVMDDDGELDPLADLHAAAEEEVAPRRRDQRQHAPAGPSRPAQPPEEDDEEDGAKRTKKKKKNFNALEALAKKQQEERRVQEEERARVAAEKAERQAARDRAEAERKKHAALMRKRNAKGQPVMRYRVEGILEKLMREQQQGAGKR